MRGNGSSRARLRDVERLLSVGDAKAALTEAERLAAHRPNDVRILGLVARAAAELNRPDQAFGAARTLRDFAGDPGRILEAELLVAIDRLPDARRALEEAAPENVVAAGMREVIELFLARSVDGAKDAAARTEPCGKPLSPELFWFEPALTTLLFLSERALRDLPASHLLHQARTSLFELAPPPAFQSPRLGPIERLIEGSRPAAVRERRHRNRQISGHLWRDEFADAVKALRDWLDEEPAVDGDSLDDRVALLAAALAVEGRFDEISPLVEKGRVDRWIAFDPTFALVLSYARLAGGEPDAALRCLNRSFDPGDPACAHLRGLADLHAGFPGRAWAWFRRAFRSNDIAVVELARRELRLLGLGPAVSASTDPEAVRNHQTA